ncbi:MAG: hypothetical protein ACI3ZQ_00560 [Candidatus Cryptobacteroides sp.]
MDTISIFLAGSTKLVEERNQIKALANDLNATYEKHGVQVLIYTYEYLGEVQDTYNRFIETKADIAIFVLRDQINSYTLEELRIATESKNKNNGKPEIFVFIHSTEGYDSSANNKELTEIIREHLGRQHYLVYNDCNELKTKAKDRLIPIIQSRLQTANQNTTKQVSSKLIRWLIASCVIFCAILTGVILFMLNPRQNPNAMASTEANDSTYTYIFSKDNPLMLITGGGSAANFVMKTKGIDLDNRKNTIRVRLPSGASWALMAEAVNSKVLNTNSKEKYIPVCLSAGKAKEKDFLTVCSKEEFKKELVIIEHELGEDPMTIYVSKNFFEKHPDLKELKKAGRVTPEEFAKLLKRGIDSSLVFATSINSGTRNAYKKFLPVKDTLLMDNDSIRIFNEASNYKHFKGIDKKGGIILGSKYYFVRSITEKEERDNIKLFDELKAVNENGKLVSKPICLYFPAWKDKTDETDGLTIMPCIYTFLKELKTDRKIMNRIKPNGDKYYFYPQKDDAMLINLEEECSAK